MSIARITMKPWDAGIHTATRRFDNTKLVALNTCPTYGIVRYELHKTYKSGSRAMALEAGSAAHEAYAAIRIGDLYLNGPAFYSDIYSADEIRSAAYDRSIDLLNDLLCSEPWKSSARQGTMKTQVTDDAQLPTSNKH